MQYSIVTLLILIPAGMASNSDIPTVVQREPPVVHFVPQAEFKFERQWNWNNELLFAAATKKQQNDDEIVPPDKNFIDANQPTETPPAPVPNPPAPTPNPAPKPAPVTPPAPGEEGKPPQIKITAPQYVELNNFIRVEINSIGGAIREQEISIDPEPDKNNFEYGFRDVEINGEKVRVEDQTKFHFILPKAGIVTITVLAIGRDVGYSKTEARIQVRDSRQPVVKPDVQPPKTAGPNDPREQLREWVSKVDSKNRHAEAQQIARAARETAARMKPPNPEVSPVDAMEEWQQAAYLALPHEVSRKWTTSISASQPSFFAYVNELYNQNMQLKNSNPMNFLLSIAEILEGK